MKRKTYLIIIFINLLLLTFLVSCNNSRKDIAGKYILTTFGQTNVKEFTNVREFIILKEDGKFEYRSYNKYNNSLEIEAFIGKPTVVYEGKYKVKKDEVILNYTIKNQPIKNSYTIGENDLYNGIYRPNGELYYKEIVYTNVNSIDKPDFTGMYVLDIERSEINKPFYGEKYNTLIIDDNKLKSYYKDSEEISFSSYIVYGYRMGYLSDNEFLGDFDNPTILQYSIYNNTLLIYDDSNSGGHLSYKKVS